MRALLAFGIIAVIGLFVLFFSVKEPTAALTGNLTNICPEGFIHADAYCIDEGCLNETNKCYRDGSLIKRPDCYCMGVMGKFRCTIAASKRLAFISPMCTRRGQLGQVCGSYNSTQRQCVENLNIKEGTKGLDIQLR